jgi:hypothetical protein
MNAFGFRVKSGYAIAVILNGSVEAPGAVARNIVELCDPDVPETRQPYHSGFGEAEGDLATIARRVTIIENVADRSVAALLSAHTPGPRGRAGLVVGSVLDPASVGNPHIRAHANEGRLFRTVLERALCDRQVRCSVLVDKGLTDAARKQLRRSDAQIQRALTAFGTALGRPWRAEEKAAALAAWMALAGS